MGEDARLDDASIDAAAEVLLRGQTVLEAVAESTPDAVFVKDRAGRYLLVNSSTCRMLGKSRQEILGRDDRALFPPADAAWLMAQDASIMASGETNSVEEHLTVGGVPMTLLATKGAVRTPEGEVIGLFGISRDITERTRTDQALRESEAKFRSVFDQSPVGKSITKLTGEVDFNPAMCAMLGYTPEELRNVKFQELTHPADVALSEQAIEPLRAGLSSQTHFVKRYIRKDGRVVWAELNITVRRDADGRPLDFLTSVVDITERRQAEEALLESELRYRTLIEWTPYPLVVHRDGVVLYANPAALQMFRVPTAAALNRPTVFDRVVAEFRDFARDRNREALRQGLGATVAPAVAVLQTDDGERRHVQMQGVVVAFDGAPAVFTVFRDVTDELRKDAALRESEYLFRESQRVANIGSYRADFVAGTWRSSEVLDRIFGIELSMEHPIADWIALIHPEEQEWMAQYLKREVLTGGRRFDAEYRVQRRNDGAVRWVHGLGELEKSPDGAVVAMTGTIQDITDRRAAQAALEASEDRYRAMLQTAMDGFWVISLDGRVLEVNEAYARMSGYSVEELLTMRLSDLDAVETPAQVAQRTAEILRRGEARFESQHRRKDGTPWDVAVSVQYRRSEGHMVAFVQDITARKQAEGERAQMQAQLQQAQKMESVGRLAGGVAHDFNNMLGVILGNVDMALEQVPLGDPLRDDLDEVRRAAVRSVDLTRQLLAFARKQTVAPQVLDLNVTVAGMAKMLQRLIGEDIALDWRAHAGLWPVKIDPSQVDQVLANLCVNARDAISGTGTLVIETAHRHFTEEDLALRPEVAAGDYVELAVRDDGSGMSPETIVHLFEPFYTTKAQGKGTGLGLATVWGIVRQNNGFIEVDSARGEGTTFRIYLPRHQGKLASASADEPAAEGRRGHETILLAEDEPGILALTARMLERQGYTVLRAVTPGEALRLAREYPGQI
ncbi:MAG: PAS domain S-box protein, partial [Gemmatimonadota bacterium]|nr:PAS domain S-box protein [Gemmatimonadota bacterium]